MSELKSIINEFDIKLNNDHPEDDERRRKDHGEIDFDDFDGEGGEDNPSDELGLDSEFDAGDEEGEEDLGIEGDTEGDFAGEKRTDITNKLKAMLQGRETPEDEMEDESGLPSLSDLDLDDEDDLDNDEDEDLDFDYNAFSDEREQRPEDEDEEGEFSFSTFNDKSKYK